jgi:hypothetical protein
VRLGEIVALEGRDIDFRRATANRRAIRLVGHVTVLKGGRSRQLPLTRRLTAALRSARHLRSERELCLSDRSPSVTRFHPSARGRRVSDLWAWRFAQGCAGRARRRHEMQRQSPVVQDERAFGMSQIDAGRPSRFAARPQEPAALWWRVSCSRRLEGNVEELGGRLSVLEAFGNNAECKGLDAGHGFIAILAVAQDTGQTRDLRNPPTVVFAFELDREGHARKCTIAAGIHQTYRRSPLPPRIMDGCPAGNLPTAPVRIVSGWKAKSSAPNPTGRTTGATTAAVYGTRHQRAVTSRTFSERNVYLVGLLN